MKTTAFEQKDAQGKLVNPSNEQKAKQLLMRTKGWSATITAGFVATLLPDELQALVHLEDSPSLRGDEVNCILDEVEDRQAAEAALAKQKEQQAAEETIDDTDLE